MSFVGYTFKLAPTDVFQYDSTTRRDVRRRGITTAAAAALAQALAEEGRLRILGAVWPGNLGAVQTSKRAGFRPVATVYCFSIGPWRRRVVRASRRKMARASS